VELYAIEHLMTYQRFADMLCETRADHPPYNRITPDNLPLSEVKGFSVHSELRLFPLRGHRHFTFLPATP
jgi:hypothetical protein